MPPQNDLVAATVAAHRSVLLHSTSGSITQLAGGPQTVPSGDARCRLVPKNAMSTETHRIVALGPNVREPRITERSFQIGKLVEVESICAGRLEAHELLPDRERHSCQTAGLEDSMHLPENGSGVRNHVHRGDRARLV